MHQNLRKHALKCMFIIYLFLTGCATTWSHQSGNNSNFDPLPKMKLGMSHLAARASEKNLA